MKLTKPSSVWEIPLGKVFYQDSPARGLRWRGVLFERLTSEIAEVRALRGIRQEKKFHGDRDALEHTRLALQVVSETADERVLWAVLLHDIGKSLTTVFRQGKWRAHGHAFEGSRMAESFLWRIGRSDLASDVAWLVRYHHFSMPAEKCSLSGLSEGQLKILKNPLFVFLLEVEKAIAAANLGKEKIKRVSQTERVWREI